MNKRDIDYLSSILTQLRVCFPLCPETEAENKIAFSENIDWLSSFIDREDRKRAKKAIYKAREYIGSAHTDRQQK